MSSNLSFLNRKPQAETYSFFCFFLQHCGQVTRKLVARSFIAADLGLYRESMHSLGFARRIRSDNEHTTKSSNMDIQDWQDLEQLIKIY